MTSVSEREQRILGIIETARAKRAKFRDERITMAHGAGGRATRSLVEGLLAPAFGIETLDDAALVGDLAITTDAYVVKPLRFPGGSIGELAVNGTVNDLAMAGAQPLALTLSLILEEGLDADVAARRGRRDRATRRRRRESASSAATPRSSSAATPTGCTSRPPGSVAATRAPPSSPHGPATASCSPARSARTAPRSCSRAASSNSTPTIDSDTRSLWPAVDAILGPGIRVMRDATRGGVASVLNELARAAGVAMLVAENRARAPAVAGACELLGIDPMYVANEGVFVAIVAPDVVVEGFADIGEIKTEPPGMVLVETSFGGKRVMDELVGDPLPRIC